MGAFSKSANSVKRCLAVFGAYVCSALSVLPGGWFNSHPADRTSQAATVAGLHDNALPQLIDVLSDSRSFDAVLQEQHFMTAESNTANSAQPSQAMKLKSHQQQQAMKLQPNQPQQTMKLRPQQPMKLRSNQ